MSLDATELWLAGIALVAAMVNGGLGYGFSSITVPLALLFMPNRVLSPALVLVEVFINVGCIAMNRRGLAVVWRRTLPLLVGMLPGAALGTWALAEAGHGTLRLATYAVLLPLILLQAAGLRFPLRSEQLPGVPLGAGVGALYAATTISGPPLALLLNNQGYGQSEFRAALGLFRLAEAVTTAALYASLGLFTHASLHTSAVVAPSIALGMPLGFWLLRKLSSESFRRLCMGGDALLVGFGLVRAVLDRHLVADALAWAGFALVMALEGWLLWRYFKAARAAMAEPAPARA